MRKISARKPISAKALFWVLGFISATIVFTAPDDAGSEDVGGVAKRHRWADPEIERWPRDPARVPYRPRR